MAAALAYGSRLNNCYGSTNLQNTPSSRPPLWLRNRQIAWVSFCVGVGTGMIMGMWSFGGPFPVPAWLGEYDDLSRRLARLGHIAFFGLGFLNLFLASELQRTTLGPSGKRWAALAMNVGNVFLPLTLFAAAAYHPLKYFMSVPAGAVLLALVLAAYGAWGDLSEWEANRNRGSTQINADEEQKR